jgi:outer membrane translocation and assembly module TamA
LNSEARFPIPLKKGLGGVIFYDGGNVYDRINVRRLFNDYSNTLGFGIRYQTPVGPVRVDIGRNLNPITGLKSTQIFVTLGQSFCLARVQVQSSRWRATYALYRPHFALQPKG